MQTCITKFFKSLGNEKPNYEWLFQKEEADRKKRQEEAQRRRRELEQRRLEVILNFLNLFVITLIAKIEHFESSSFF
jgi:hypothetical protein